VAVDVGGLGSALGFAIERQLDARFAVAAELAQVRERWGGWVEESVRRTKVGRLGRGRE
jgi:hypothetical protein